MSLDFNLTGIKDYETVCWKPSEHDRPNDGIKKGDTIMSPITNAIIWACLTTGIGKIKDAAEADEFYARLHLWETTSGAGLSEATEDGWKPRYITREEVHQHIGLSTNVFPRETDAKWLKRFYEQTKRGWLRKPVEG